MAVTILLSRLAVTWLIVLKQLDEAIASLTAQLKNGQAESITICSVSTQQNISQKHAFNKFVALNLFSFLFISISVLFVISSCNSFSFFQRNPHKPPSRKKKNVILFRMLSILVCDQDWEHGRHYNNLFM